ncbi:MAG: DUF1588 domain-containing protein [Planctomycetota bacterium]|nr:DUF1588 domain-containing protein [Planctomycetota bacterium]
METEPRFRNRRKTGTLLAGSLLIGCILSLVSGTGVAGQEPATELFKTYCFDCHADGVEEGGLDLETLCNKPTFDATLAFEHLITQKMPPRDADQPSEEERIRMLRWLADRQIEAEPPAHRRISRFEFNQSVNDLLGTELQIAKSIPSARGTHRFDSDRRITLTGQQLAAYFKATDQMLEAAFPQAGFLPEIIWNTNRIRDSHHTYNIYTRPYRKGILFSWTRANNGNSYSFFYDDFAPPVAGWYELTFDAAKVGDFEEDITIQVHAGKYYFADDRPQPQRIIDVISVGNREVASYKVRGFFHPGESVSVHCYSRHTWRQENTQKGIYIERLAVRGPLHQWPPLPFAQTFAGLKLDTPVRNRVNADSQKSALERIGGSLSVSSFQAGREKEQMLDGSNRTYWQSQTSPHPAEPPHFVTIENPQKAKLSGLDYSTPSGGDGSGQVKTFEVYASDDQADWGAPLVRGELLTRLAAEQRIHFPAPTDKRFIKFLITDSDSTGEQSLASIGKLDVVADVSKPLQPVRVRVASSSEGDLKRILHRFAERAFSSRLHDDELAPYLQMSREVYRETGDFVSAAKLGIKAILCSHRFLLRPGPYDNDSYRIAAELARTLWLSVPDEQLSRLAKSDQLTKGALRNEIDRMLDDDKSTRMIHSFCDQWLNLRSFRQVTPSLKLYPTYGDLLDYYLPLETEAYLRYLILENLPVGNLIDSDFSFLNQRLAQHYGIEGVTGQRLRKTAFPTESLRGGLLTMGSVLKVTTDGFDTSPIRRGAWISKNVVGNTLAPPPANVSSIEPDTSGATTIRQQMALHQENASCATCHRSIDPYGFALEGFDAVGQERTRYRVSRPHGGTFGFQREGHFSLAGEVDSSGQLEGEEFADVRGLKKILLANEKKIAYNFMKQFFEYANGRPPSLAERIALSERIEDAGRMKDLVKEVLMLSFAGEQIKK